MFKRSNTSGGDNGTTRIMSDDGNAKYEGRSNMKTTQDALRENKSQSKDTNSR
jgi:hypothetical protein